MNIEEKTKLAHEYLRDIISNWDFNDSFNPVSEAWEYADAMEVEYNKRKKQQTVEDISQDVGLFEECKHETLTGEHPSWNTEYFKCRLCGDHIKVDKWKDSLRKHPK